MGLCTLPSPPRYKRVLYFLLLPNTRRLLLLLQFVHHQKLQLPLHDQHTWNRNFHFLPSPHTEHLFISLKHRVAFIAKTEEGPDSYPVYFYLQNGDDSPYISDCKSANCDDCLVCTAHFNPFTLTKPSNSHLGTRR